MINLEYTGVDVKLKQIVGMRGLKPIIAHPPMMAIAQGTLSGQLTVNASGVVYTTGSTEYIPTDSIKRYIEETITEQYEKKIAILQERIKTMEMNSRKDITDIEAETAIKDHLISFVDTGKKRINILDLVLELGLPPEQIERIMAKLSSEGVKLIE